MIPLDERHVLSTEWKRGLCFIICDRIASSIFLSVRPDVGSTLSKLRLAVSSQVELEHILSERAACLAAREEYLALHLKKIWSGKVGLATFLYRLGRFWIESHTIWLIFV